MEQWLIEEELPHSAEVRVLRWVRMETYRKGAKWGHSMVLKLFNYNFI